MKIELDNETIEIKLKGRHIDKGFDLYTKISDDEKGFDGLNKYLKYIDDVLIEVTGKTKEQLGDMDSEDLEKLRATINNKIEAKVDFLKPSQKQQTYTPRAKS